MTEVTVVTRSPAETRSIGASLGRLLDAGAILLLDGDLGAGKTTFVQGVMEARRPGETVQSPTFTLVNSYPPTAADPVPIQHLDLYRLSGPDDLDSIGFDGMVLAGDSIMLVEWPERLESDLPPDFLAVILQPADNDERLLTLRPIPADGRHAALLDRWNADRPCPDKNRERTRDF